MNLTEVKPTIGRVVWLWVSAQRMAENDFSILDNAQALKAEVCFVNPDGTVNLDVCDHSGECSTEFDVPLRDYRNGDAHGFDQPHEDDYTVCATWMPYQMKKHAEEAVSKSVVPEYPATIPPAVINPTMDGTAPSLILTDGKDV